MNNTTKVHKFTTYISSYQQDNTNLAKRIQQIRRLLLLLFLSVSSKFIDEVLSLYQASQKPSKYDKHNIPNVSYFLHLHETIWLNEREHNMKCLLSFITGWIMSSRKYRPWGSKSAFWKSLESSLQIPSFLALLKKFKTLYAISISLYTQLSRNDNSAGFLFPTPVPLPFRGRFVFPAPF